MKSPLLIGWTAAALLVSLGGCAPRERSGERVDEAGAWELAALSLHTDAARGFRSLAAGAAPSEEARFGMAIALLTAQPKTPANIAQAEAILDELSDSARDPELRVAAQYYRARIEQAHRFVPDFAAASIRYRALMEASPESVFGQLAALKWCLLELYRFPDEEFEQRFEEVGALEAMFSIPEMKKDFHLSIAQARLRSERRDALALRHLRLAADLGVQREHARANALAGVVNLAHELGELEVARQYGQAFLQEFERDPRASVVRSMMGRGQANQP
jgi:hypothetical protein